MTAKTLTTDHIEQHDGGLASMLDRIAATIGEIARATSRAHAIVIVTHAIQDLLGADAVRLVTPSDIQASKVHHIPAQRHVPSRLFSSTAPNVERVCVEAVFDADDAVRDQKADCVVALLNLLAATLDRFDGPTLTHDPCRELSDHLAPLDSPEKVRDAAVGWLGTLFGGDYARLTDIILPETDYPGLLPEITTWSRTPTVERPVAGVGQEITATIAVDGRPDVVLAVGTLDGAREWVDAGRGSLLERLVPVLRRHLNRTIHSRKASIRAEHLQAL